MFQPGELVNVRLDGVRYIGCDEGQGHGIETPDGSQWSMPWSAVIERMAPKEWPPQVGDIWTNPRGFEWLGRANGELFGVDTGDGGLWTTIDRIHGPMRLVRRRGWTPDAPTDEPTTTHTDKRTGYVATLRALAAFVETRTDLPVPNDVVSAQASQYGGFEKQTTTVEAAATALGVEVRRFMFDGRDRAVAEYRDPAGFKYVVYASLDTPAAEPGDPAAVGGETVEDAEAES